MISTKPNEHLFTDIGASQYNRIWGAWKIGSLGLFGIFVGCAIDIALSMRKQVGR